MSKKGFFFALFLAVWVVPLHAALTIHLQSPFRDDSSKDSYGFHVLGSAGGSYNPIFDANSPTLMTSEGNGWVSYTWEKSIGDFQTWQTFNVKACPSTADNNFNNNNCVAWTDTAAKTVELSMSAAFGSDVEIWIYTEADGSFEKSFMAPGSKIVWFKSPWGNKALPQMVFGKDSVLMRFAIDDSSKCGWFYGAITPEMLAANPVQTAHFLRYKTPYQTLPVSGTVELSGALSKSDTVFIDGTIPEAAQALKVSSVLGTLGTCFDSSRTLHVYHPWRTNTTYRDSALYITVGNNILNNPVAMDSANEFKRWWHYDFSSAVVGGNSWNTSSATVNFYRRQNEWPQVTYFEEGKKPLVASFFPSGVYEAWVYTRGQGEYDLEFTPPEEKIIRLMSPWDDMTPSMLVNRDTVKMGPFSPDTCGWYQAAYYKHVENWEVLFKQTFGFSMYSVSGAGNGDPLVLDSVLKTADTVWIMPYPTLSSAPKVSTEFPGRLGICPTLQISAMLLDWAGESYADSIDIDFGGIYDGNDYTMATFLDSAGNITSAKSCQGHVLGMVQETLGKNGFPLRSDSLLYPWAKCAAAHEVEKWFVPVEIAKDASGKSYTNATCRDIDLTLDEEGFWLADITDENGCSGGFYPLDDFEYLDSAKTVKNPKFDWDIQGCKHNYSFAMKISAQFQYIKGQYFEFRGDDDVWVYINNRLVVDIGGCHSPVEGSVNLDTLGLIEGQEYPFHIFFSERNATGSNFKMRTSINLQTEKTYYPREIPQKDGTIVYEIWQMLMDESLSCDISSVTKIDTVPAASVFLLTGDNLPKDGVTLGPGLNYGGIEISETMAGFFIDTTAIVRTRELLPGTYCLHFFLESDLTQSSKVYFTVPEYPLPTIVFADSLGNEIDPDTVTLGQYAFVLYPVNIKVLYYGELCTDCIVSLNLNTKDKLSFFDENSFATDTVKTDSTGHARFYVMGNESVENASFKVSGSEVENTLVWKNIKLEKPPVPVPLLAEMHDRDGNGVADSLILAYTESLKSDDFTMDTVGYAFGDSLWHYTAPKTSVSKKIKKDSVFVWTADSLVQFKFTGEKGNAYFGSSKTHFTYIDSTGEKVPFPLMYPITDRIAPLVQKAVAIPKSDNATILSIYFSESLDSNAVNDSALFDFRIWRNGHNVGKNVNVRLKTFGADQSFVEILFAQTEATDVLPAVGDSVRFMPKHATDLSGNKAHKNNPWIRIEGEQRLRTEKTDVFVLNPEKLPEYSSKKTVQMFVVSAEKSFEKIQEEIGLPGQLLRFDMSEIFLGEEDLKPKDVYLVWENYLFTNLGTYVNSEHGRISCADSLFGGDCRKAGGLIYLAWDMRSANGRLVGTGAYISKVDIAFYKKRKKIAEKASANTFGIRREEE